MRTLPAIAAILCFSAACASTAKAAIRFEPFEDSFNAVGGGVDARIEPGALRLHKAGATTDSVITWLRGAPMHLEGRMPTGGHTNYYSGARSSQWRLDVPHFEAVRGTGLYPGIELMFRSISGAFEFDVLAAPRANIDRVRFEVSSASITEQGDLQIAGGPLLKRPKAWQEVDGVRRSVPCSFEIEAAGPHSIVGFEIGEYDHALPLTIDPIVEYVTYLAGDGRDTLQAVTVDASGSAVVTGTSTSSNFPGAAPGANTAFAFVMKLTPDASAISWVDVFDSGPFNSQNGAVFFSDGIAALDMDANGNVYVAGGASYPSTIPVTAGAWQSSGNSYAMKIDPAGHMAYCTFTGGPGWPLSGTRLRARNGIVYIAGTVSRPAFLGTAGAYQRDLRGSANFFALALNADGSAPLFITALGGSGSDVLSDMALDAQGNLLLAGTSTSSDFPLAPGSLPYNSGAVIARLSSDGTQLLDSTRLGAFGVSALTTTRDGSRIIAAGNDALPADLIAAAPANSTIFVQTGVRSYLAEFSLSPVKLLWSTSNAFSFQSPVNLAVDAGDAIYLTSNTPWFSGGSSISQNANAIFKITGDGSRIDFIGSGFSSTSGALLAVSQDGHVTEATSAYNARTTPGVLEPTAPVKKPYPNQFLPPTSGLLGRFDLSGITGDNFFLKPDFGLNVTWRVGEPAAAASTIPLAFNTSPFPLNLTSSSPLFTGTVSPGNSTIALSAVPSPNASAGTTQQTLTVSAASNSSKAISVPLTLTVQPQVSIALDNTQVSAHTRVGQNPPTVNVGVTENFGNESFNLNAVTNSGWMSVSANGVSQGRGQLSIYFRNQAAGTYDGTITVSIGDLQNGKQTINVHYVVDPAATIQLSTATPELHVVKGQPVQPVTVDVTGSVPGVSFSMFVGVSATWLQYKTIGTTTPGQIQFTADASAAPPGYYSFNFFVSGENNQRIDGTVYVDISDGSPLNAAPSAITNTFYRGGQYIQQASILTLTAPSPTPVSWSIPDSFVLPPRAGNLTTPNGIYLNFDSTLPEGVYKSTLSAKAGSTTVSVPVTFNLYDIPRLLYKTDPFTFNYQIGGPLPPAQTLAITTTTIQPGGFSDNPSTNPSFLSVSPAFGLTPGTLTLTVNPAGLAPGTYTSGVLISAAGGPIGTIGPFTTIPVTLNVTADPNAPAHLASVVDAASYLGGGVSPGEIVALFGSQLGPANLVSAQLDASGRFPTSLAGTTVYFDNVAAPIIYTSAGQVSVVVPYEVSSKTSTSVSIAINGKASTPLVIPVLSANPSVFTANASGSGQAAALRVSGNSTSITNSGNPLAAGDTLVLFATGLGALSPSVTDGSIIAAPLPSFTNSSIKLLLGGQIANVTYAGPAPGLVAGVAQLNVTVPQNLASGQASVVIVSAGNASAPGVTVAVR